GHFRLCADPATARAAHSPLQGDVQHLHQPGPASHCSDHLHESARTAGPAAHGAGLGRQCPHAGAAPDGGAGRRAGVLRGVFPRGCHSPAAAGGQGTDSAGRTRHPGRFGSAGALSGAGELRSGLRHRDQDGRGYRSVRHGAGSRAGLSVAHSPDKTCTTMTERLIFEYSQPGRSAVAQLPQPQVADDALADIPADLLRTDSPGLPEVSEMDTVRHYTRLSQLNFSIDTQFYPLGSCTMKYNPRACNTLALQPGFLGRHPLAPVEHGQGFLACLYELQEILTDVTGMEAVSLTPMAGVQGEFSGVAMIKAYHDSRGDTERTEILVPDAAHGTNPATATMCGCTVREIPTAADGDV